jgi:hypothetical protein
MSIVRIDLSPEARRAAGTCKSCKLSRTVYPAVDSEGVWGWICRNCAGSEIEVMR